jgi:glycosyltransferase involved in cell wall biosynthesis
VKVLSLGKEKRISRGYYLKHFYEYILKYRAEYDSVFVHMNQEYVLLGGIFWKLFGKKVYMWRNHYAGSYLTDMAAFFCTKVFCTSKYSFTAKYSKAVLMPVGIDTESFCLQRNVSRRPQSILSLGRIAPSKNLDQLIEALGILKKENIDFDASIVGDALPQDGGYLESLKNRAGELGMEGQVIFKPGVPNDQTPSIYSAHEIFVNLSPSGMLDKTIFEAMACGALALSCNMDLARWIDADYIFEENNVDELSVKIAHLLALSPEERSARAASARRFVEENHGLFKLGSRLAEEMSA